MRSRQVLTSVLVLWASVVAVRADERSLYYETVKPLLRSRCFACHGALKQESGLRLDTRAAMIKRGAGQDAVIVPGKPGESTLLDRISATDEGERMPPEGEPLTSEQKNAIRRWIAAGAPADERDQPETDPRDHWSFRSVERPAVPNSLPAWTRNPIDAFVAQRHKAHGLTPQKEAPRLTLIRRLYIDLVGVPPSNEELTKLDADQSSGWYERLVERLLNDPRHGERWGRHWMDIWRYSDWWGLGAQLRYSQKHIWHWRDWIIHSLNNDVAYDEMVRQMLAADELYPDDPAKLRATGFLARNYFLFNRNQWMEETVEHVGKGLLGLTFNCAKCHDHKYDPIEQQDFYRMRAFFEPYHVRTDAIKGELDLARDGIPRVFDGWLDKPTYLFVRGQEKQPDKSIKITAGLPGIFDTSALRIEPVKLPGVAWQPERKRWVADTLLQRAEATLKSAGTKSKTRAEKLVHAQAKLAKLVHENKEAEPPTESNAAGTNPPAKRKPTPLIHETFATTLDPSKWLVHGSGWEQTKQGLKQKTDGPTRSILRWKGKVPRDFEATLTFTTTGGSKWRSVGIAFDATQKDVSQSYGPKDTEQTVYVSAWAVSQKIQAAYQRGGKYQYPPNAMVSLPIKLNQKYELKVQVRGSLVVGSLDGKRLVIWQTPLQRTDGALQFTAFDALVTFHDIKIAPLEKLDLRPPLPSAKELQNPTTVSVAKLAVDIAKAEVDEANAALKWEQAKLDNLSERILALRAKWARFDGADNAKTVAETRLRAIRSDRQLAEKKAAADLAKAKLEQLTAMPAKQAATAASVQKAQAALNKATAALKAKITDKDEFQGLSAAKWTPTRFDLSSRDDTEVKFSPQSTGRRKALAEWVTQRRNPLTARVAVNHIWSRHLGTPLVKTVFDFGRNGDRPTHPLLLDWLASEFMDHGWSMKHIHRLIVTSAVYRMDSTTKNQTANLARDADNRWLWRRTPQRMESQVIRDSLLSHAGIIESNIGGPPVPNNLQADSRRRSLYFYHSNNSRNQFLTTFDEAMVRECYRREESVVPQQALALSNSKLVLDLAPQIGRQISRNATDDDEFIRSAFQTLLGFAPNQAEQDASRRALLRWKQLQLTSDQARGNLIWTLINHNDFVTLR